MRVDNKISIGSQIMQYILSGLINFGLRTFRFISEKLIKKNPLY